MNALEFINSIDTAKPAPVYLFCPGKSNPRARQSTFEPFLAERAVDAFIARHVDESVRDFAFASFYADEAPAGQIVNEAMTLPFLAERRVLLVRHAEKYDSESAAGAMLRYLESPNESSIVLFVAGKLDKRTKFYKACGKAGEIVECAQLSEREVTKWLLEEAKTAGRKIQNDAAQEIVRRAGVHMSDVHNAFMLVSNFVGDPKTPIALEHVVAACADVAEEEVWALTDAIAANEAGAALASLRRLLELGKHPDELIGTINWLLKNAYAVAIANGEPGISRFVADKVRPLAFKLGVKKIRDAFALCTDTQFMMRNTGTNAPLALELLVVKLAASRPRKTA